MNNSTFKLADVHKLLRDRMHRFIPVIWKKFIRHTQKEKERFWEIDFIVDDVLVNMGLTVMTIIGDRSDSEFDSE